MSVYVGWMGTERQVGCRVNVAQKCEKRLPLSELRSWVLMYLVKNNNGVRAVEHDSVRLSLKPSEARHTAMDSNVIITPIITIIMASTSVVQ